MEGAGAPQIGGLPAPRVVPPPLKGVLIVSSLGGLVKNSFDTLPGSFSSSLNGGEKSLLSPLVFPPRHLVCLDARHNASHKRAKIKRAMKSNESITLSILGA